MHWILIIYLGSYGMGEQPHFMGDFASNKGCESMLSQLQKDKAEEHKDDLFAKAPLRGKCFYVEN